MTVVAAVDCGTNSTRLLVARARGDGTLEDLERVTTVTRLGRGVDASGRLSTEGVERTVGVLRRYAETARRHGAERIRAVATSAARDAANRLELFGPAAEALGVEPELLSGAEEGRLAFAGATAGLDRAGETYLVVDVGGGSTELVLGRGGEVVEVASLDIGSVRITEQWLHGDPPTAEELSMAVSVARTHVDGAVRERPALAEPATVVGVAGTVTTIAAIELGYYDPEAVHHLWLERRQVEDVFRAVATEPLELRRHNPGLHPDRADVIVGGCCVLVGIMRRLDVAECLVSDSDLLDALAAEAMGRSTR